jgi:hypothetical protein
LHAVFRHKEDPTPSKLTDQFTSSCTRPGEKGSSGHVILLQ